jgi:hypothetical protein
LNFDSIVENYHGNLNLTIEKIANLDENISITDFPVHNNKTDDFETYKRAVDEIYNKKAKQIEENCSFKRRYEIKDLKEDFDIKYNEFISSLKADSLDINIEPQIQQKKIKLKEEYLDKLNKSKKEMKKEFDISNSTMDNNINNMDSEQREKENELQNLKKRLNELKNSDVNSEDNYIFPK